MDNSKVQVQLNNSGESYGINCPDFRTDGQKKPGTQNINSDGFDSLGFVVTDQDLTGYRVLTIRQAAIRLVCGECVNIKCPYWNKVDRT